MSEFNLYPNQVRNLGGTISEKATNYLNKIDEVTKLVNELSAVWGGPTYETFKSSYDSKLANLEELNTVLKEFSNNVNTTAEEGQQMINQINSLME